VRQSCKDGYGCVQNVRSVYPKDIYYNKFQNTGIPADDYHVNIHFNFSYDVNDPTDGFIRTDNVRSNGPHNPAPEVMEDRRLDSIEVKVDGVLVRKYVLPIRRRPRTHRGWQGE